MKQIDTAAIAADPETRMEFLEDFVGFTEDDWKALSESIRVIGPQLPGILDALYDHLLTFDDTRRIFLGPRGEIDPSYIELRKEHLTAWVLTTVAGGSRRTFANYLMATGRRHTGVAGERGRSVPPRYMVGLTSHLQTAMLSAVFRALPADPAMALRMGLAWNKMLIIQLEMFLKVIGPHWPRWDEA
jgi:hypothetical protein